MKTLVAPPKTAVEKKEKKQPIELPTEEELVKNWISTPKSGRMDPGVKAKWVAALRGEFAGLQIRGRLKGKKTVMIDGQRVDVDAFCVLGVLCELHAREEGGSWDSVGAYEGRSGSLGPRVAKWAGLPGGTSPIVRPKGQVTFHTLVTVNDRIGLTLPEIADLIEEQL